MGIVIPVIDRENLYIEKCEASNLNRPRRFLRERTSPGREPPRAHRRTPKGILWNRSGRTSATL